MSLRDEILGVLDKVYQEHEIWNDKIATNDILNLFEKRIDSIEYYYDMEWHCQNAMDYTKNEMKEMLK